METDSSAGTKEDGEIGMIGCPGYEARPTDAALGLDTSSGITGQLRDGLNAESRFRTLIQLPKGLPRLPAVFGCFEGDRALPGRASRSAVLHSSRAYDALREGVKWDRDATNWQGRQLTSDAGNSTYGRRSGNSRYADCHSSSGADGLATGPCGCGGRTDHGG